MTKSKYTTNMLTGLLQPVDYQSSPHHDDRPAGMAVDIVGHADIAPVRKF